MRTGDSNPLDLEVILPGEPLATLSDYAGIMKAMQGGADILILWEQRGMDVTSWTRCVTAWGQIMMKRPDLAQRFGTLLTR